MHDVKNGTKMEDHAHGIARIITYRNKSRNIKQIQNIYEGFIEAADVYTEFGRQITFVGSSTVYKVVGWWCDLPSG